MGLTLQHLSFVLIIELYMFIWIYVSLLCTIFTNNSAGHSLKMDKHHPVGHNPVNKQKANTIESNHGHRYYLVNTQDIQNNMKPNERKIKSKEKEMLKENTDDYKQAICYYCHVHTFHGEIKTSHHDGDHHHDNHHHSHGHGHGHGSASVSASAKAGTGSGVGASGKVGAK